MATQQETKDLPNDQDEFPELEGGFTDAMDVLRAAQLGEQQPIQSLDDLPQCVQPFL